MTIADVPAEIKRISALLRAKIGHPSAYFPLVLVLVALASFGLGRLSYLEERRVPVRITGGEAFPGSEVGGQRAAVRSAAPVAAENSSDGGVVASKNGTRYYYPRCSGVSRINKENLISFRDAAEAEAAGLTLASGCTK